MTASAVITAVLDAVNRGDLPRGGPSHIAALDLLDELPADHFEKWGIAAAERIRPLEREDGR